MIGDVISMDTKGYSSGSYYKQYFPTVRSEVNSQWQKAMMATIFLYPSIVVAVTAGLNFIAIYYETISVIPVGVVLKMIAIWFFVALPLAIAGALSRY
jgi:hypothetical protein